MEPVTAPPTPFAEFVRTNRTAVGGVLLAVAAAFLAGVVFFTYKVVKGAPAADTPAVTAEGETPPPPPADPNRPGYMIAAIGCTAGTLLLGAMGCWLLASLPPPSAAKERTDIRVVFLAGLGSLGAIAIVVGLVYFYLWTFGAGSPTQDNLVGWLERDDPKARTWVLVPFLLVVAGAGLVLAGILPARAEERSNAWVRRLVYGANLGLGLLLLFVALVVGNVVVGLKVPSRLDTTQSGFYTLTQPTVDFLGKLDQPVTAYVILPEGDRVASDTRKMLTAFQEKANGKFKAKFLGTTLNRTELTNLRSKYPQLELNEIGVLLTVGEDEKRHAFIRDDEFSARGAGGKVAFQGEGRVMKELVFLAENQKKPAVYFTQSNGELDVSGGPGGEAVPPSQSAAQLKAYLEKNYLDVRPLAFDAANPTVPPDADVVVVADPRSPLSEKAAAAIGKYMTDPRPDGKKGKLVVLASAHVGADRKVIKTGLEGVLEPLGVRVGDRVILSDPTQQLPDPFLTVVGFARAAVAANNPIAISMGQGGFVAPYWREVAAAPGGNPAYKVTPLLATLPGEGRRQLSWLETERPADPMRNLEQLVTSRELMVEKRASGSPRPVAVVVSEGAGGPPMGGPPPSTPRLAVVGNGLIASDQVARQSQGTNPLSFDLVGATIDWLRDRPVADTAAGREYVEFTMPASVDSTRLLWLPLGLALLLVTGLGVGVWVIRRQ